MPSATGSAGSVKTLYIEPAWENGYNESFNSKLEILNTEIFYTLKEEGRHIPCASDSNSAPIRRASLAKMIAAVTSFRPRGLCAGLSDTARARSATTGGA